MLWLWFRLAAAVPIPPLTWELPYAVGAALKRKTKNKQTNQKKAKKKKNRLPVLQMVKKCFTSFKFLIKSRSWEVLGRERGPGSESFQKERRGGLWQASFTLLVDFHEQTLSSWSLPWKAHPASGDRKVRGPGQWGLTLPQPWAASRGSASSPLPSPIFFLPLFLLLLPFSTQELLAKN